MKQGLFALVLVLQFECLAMATDFYVDPTYAGGTRNGSAAAPWRSLTDTVTNNPWTVINATLASTNVTVYCSARNAGSDTDEIYGGGAPTEVDLNGKTDTSGHLLTLNGRSQYNTSDTTPNWAAYSGASRCNVRDIISQNPSHIKRSNITVDGFRVSMTVGGKAVSICGDNWTLTNSNVYHTSTATDGPVVLVVPTADALNQGSAEYCPPSSNITISNNSVHDSYGELVYVGGGGCAVTNSNGTTNCLGFPSHSNITIQNNNIYAGGVWGAQGDGIDVKGGISNLQILNNTIHDLTDPFNQTIRAIVLQGTRTGDPDSNNVISGNYIYNVNSGDGAITLANTWGTPQGIEIRNNVIANSTGSGIVTYAGTALSIFNNSIYNVTSSGIRATGTVNIRNNALLNNNGAGAQAQTSGTIIATNNSFSNSWGSTCTACVSGLTIADFVNVNASNFLPGVGSRLIDAGVTLGSFSTDYVGTVRPQGAAWDIGAYEAAGGPAPVPAITSLSIPTGNVGAPVTITGTNFGASQSTSTVTFNGTAATPTFWSATSIVVLVPVGSTTGNVVVTVGGQSSNGVSFIVTLPPPPTITSLSVNTANVGSPVTITGTNFGATQGASTVAFNGTLATPASWSATSIVVTVPIGATTGNIVVTVAGQPSNGVSFTVTLPPPPTITSLSVTSGNSGTPVGITGTNFGATQGASTVTFNGALATPASWSATSIVVTVPGGATTGNVVVTVAGQPSNGVSFTVTAPVVPSITSMSPTSGNVGTVVTITGTNFGTTQGTSTVRFNGNAASAATTWSATNIVVAVPTSATTGNVVVTVGGQSSNGVPFTVTLPPAPAITSLSVTSGNVGTAVTITGTNFGAAQGSSAVTFNGAAATATSWSPTTLVVSVPTLATTGGVVVTVAGQSSNAVTFTVLSSNYTIPPNGGQTFNVTGSNSTSQDVSHARIDGGNSSPTGVAIIDFQAPAPPPPAIRAAAATPTVLVSQVGVPAVVETRFGMAYVDIGGPVDTGVAIANQSTSSAVITYYFTDANGATVKQGSLTLKANNQISAYLDSPPFNAPVPFRGTFSFTSSAPIAMMATRNFTNERKEYVLSTMPIAITEPDAAPLLPFFADGGGWNTQVILTNDSINVLQGIVEFFGPGSPTAAATALTMTVDGKTGTSFPYTIPAHSMVRMLTQGPGSDPTHSGSVRVTPLVVNPLGGNSPNAFAILSYKSNNVTVSETSVFAVPTDTAFRMYVESTTSSQGQVLSGIALANATATSNSIVLDLTKLDGTPVGGTQTFDLAGKGEDSKFLSEMFANLPADFKGILKVTSTAPIGVLDLRARYNVRNDFLVTTIPPANVNTPITGAVVFPQIVSGGGYNTQVILFGPTGSTATGALSFISQTGTSITGASSIAP